MALWSATNPANWNPAASQAAENAKISRWENSTNINKIAKANLLRDVNRMKNDQLGMSQAEQRQLAENATQQAGAGIEAQNQEIAQQGLAAGGGAGPSARYAALQRSLGGNVAQAQSQAQTEAARISQAKKLSEKQDIDSRIAGQQAAQTQKNQYWAGIALSALNPIAKGASASITQSTG